MYKTFKEWNRNGYSIRKGSKSLIRNKNGEPVFHYNQVKKNIVLKSSSSWDSADDLNTSGGPMFGIYGNCD